jgi:hypothetical protein
MASKELWASLALVVVALLLARLLSTWSHSGRARRRSVKP